MKKHFRVTYATLTADNDELHAAYDEGMTTARSWLGAKLFGTDATETGATWIPVHNPHDPNILVSQVLETPTTDIDHALATAHKAAKTWATTPWQQRNAVMLNVADLLSERSNELAALMTLENGKNRLEALGDVEEGADMIRYYVQHMVDTNGFDEPMGSLNPAERTRSVLRPYGLWAVIAPFNYPMALSIGPISAALITGNTVVLKPSPQGTFIASKLFECFRDAGVPSDIAVLVTGGDDAGRAIVADDRVAGVTFTGSSTAGMSIYQNFSKTYPKPVMAEMGGKNAAIIGANADIAKAAIGVARSCFGFSGQKCSACSRVYVDASIYDDFLSELVNQTQQLTIGDPANRDTFIGPVVNKESVTRFENAVAHARQHGRIVHGGDVLTGHDTTPGYYVAPTIVTDLPTNDRLFIDELFVPFVAVAAIDSIGEGIDLANAHPAGLTAGFFSEDHTDVEMFLDNIEAGVVYVNRPAGATTGAWPGVQPFGGWKRSGSTGKSGGGRYYLPEFMREQSQSVVSLNE